MQYSHTMKNKTIKDFAPYIAGFAALGAAAAAAAVAFSKTSKALNDLNNISLDWGNDEALSNMLNRKENNEE